MNDKILRKTFLKAVFASAAFALFCKKEVESSAGGEEKGKGDAVSGIKMPVKKIGNTGIEIPILQLGTSQILNPVYDKVLHLCHREGASAYDTALSYGSGASHAAIAAFLGQIGDRKKVWITSKSHSGSPDSLVSDIDMCLKDLKTDYLDLYLIHGASDRSALGKEFLKAGDRLKASGKTRLFGLSTHSNCAEVMKEAAKTGGIDVILFRYNFRHFGERELQVAMDACKKKGIGLFAMKTWGSIPANDEKVVKFKSENFTLGQAKLKAVWADERIDSIVSEMTNTGEAKENIAAAKSGAPLSGQELHYLNRLAALTAHAYCAGCSGFCRTTAEGNTGISDIMRYLMYHDSYGKIDEAKRLYMGLPLRTRMTAIEDIGKSGEACPQGIDMAAKLKRARRVLEA